MNKIFLSTAALMASLVFIVIVVGSYVIVAQQQAQLQPITGEWTADANTRVRNNDKQKDDNNWGDFLKSDESKLQLNFKKQRTGDHDNQFGSPVPYSDLQGLTREQALSGGKVSFRVVREAGTVECEGTFENGKGTGTYRFTPDTGYVAAMKARGFDFELTKSKSHGSQDKTEDRVFAAAMLNVTTALADDLKSVGFGQLDVDDLFKAAIFKIDSKFMAEMKSTGFPNLTMEDLVKARIFKIDADYVRQVHEMGFAEQNFEGLVKFRIFKVTPEFLSELKTYGFTDLKPEEIVKFRIFNIDGDFIQKAKASDPNVTVEDMVQMKIGVKRGRGTGN